MTSRERVLAAMRREPVDYVPCVPFFNPLSPPQRRGCTWNFPWPEGAPYEEQLRYQIEELGVDPTVPAGIKANWPAVVATGDAVAGPGLDASKLTVVPQPDGTKQVAYNGHLLYTFISDTAPGDAKGQDLGGAWYVVTPAGDKYEAS